MFILIDKRRKAFIIHEDKPVFRTNQFARMQTIKPHIHSRPAAPPSETGHTEYVASNAKGWTTVPVQMV